MLAIAFDFAIFGDGFGMAQPYFDGRFYWLVDTMGRERNGRNGRFYRWHSWLGAQMFSTQWTHPRAGERRRLNNREYVVFSSTRRWCRVEVAWRLADVERRSGVGVDAENGLLAAVKSELDRL